MTNSSNWFISRKAELVFYLTRLDGEARCNALAIEEAYYEDPELAKKWYERLLVELGPCDNENRAAIDKLQRLYQGMSISTENDSVESENQSEFGKKLKHVVIPHQEEAFVQFSTFLKMLQVTLEEYYFQGLWMQRHRGPNITATFIHDSVDRIIACFATAYTVHYNELFPEITKFKPNDSAFVLGARVREDRDGKLIDVVGNDESMRPYYHDKTTTLERLMEIYAKRPNAMMFANLDVPMDTLIRVIIAETFASMTHANHLDSSHPRPAAWPYLVKRVQDVRVDARLVIGADLVWIPVTPDGESFPKMIDKILELDE